MIVALQIAAPMRNWQLRLAEALEAAGHDVTIDAILADPPRPRSWPWVVAAERHLYRKRSAMWAAAPSRPRERPGLGPAIRIVLAGPVPDGVEAIVLCFDGQPGERALFQALLQGRAPIVTVRRSSGELLAAGLPAVEDPHILSRALDGVLARSVTLLMQAVAAAAAGEATVASPEAVGPRRVRSSPPHFLARGVARKIARRYGPAKGRANHWRIAYRSDPVGVAKIGAWPDGGFSTVPDDGMRFYADPFPFEHQGRRCIFFEDFPYATKKGVIGVVELDADGRPSAPHTVLEQPFHLSYPFLLRHGSEIYMLPEMSGAGCIQLFRADPFPDRWVPDKILVENVIASDATLIQHDGRYWMFATLTEEGGSTWDQLGLFYAPSLLGPWTAHPRNPVLIDAGAARPAGAMWHEDGHLMRIVQDCRTGYGAGLAICRVDRLDPEGFAQTVVARLAPPAGFAASGVHTLNRCGDLEVIDLRVPHPKRKG